MQAIEIGIGAAAILISVGALASGIGAWKELIGREGDPAPDDFLAPVAVFGSAIFLVGILWTGAPLYMLALGEPL